MTMWMSRLNQDLLIRKKRLAAIRGKPFSGSRGGNGGLTQEQELLRRSLGWTAEYTIATGNPSWRGARMDLAWIIHE